MIYAEVDQNDLNLVLTKLHGLEKAPNHLRNAINRTATQAQKMLKDGQKAGYTLKARKFNSGIKLQRATANHLNAVIRATGKPHTIQSFKTTYPKAGGKADVTKSGLKKLKTSAGASFIPKGGKASGLMVTRRSKEKTPTVNGVHALKNIHVLHGPSVPKMVEKIYKGERGGQGDMKDKIQERLHDEILKEIAKIM